MAIPWDDVAPDTRANVAGTTAATSSTVDPLADSRWAAFAGSHPSAVVFHQPAWIRVLTDVFGYEPRFHVSRDARGEITAAWPSMVVRSRLTGTRLVCLPFCHRAGPLVDSSDSGRILLDALTSDAQEVSTLRISKFATGPGGSNSHSACNRGTSILHAIDLASNSECLLPGFDRDVRYSIRRAQRDGVSVRLAGGPDDVRAFYRLYVRQRKRQGLLPQPESFITQICESIVDAGDGFLVLAAYNDQPVAGLLSSHRDTVIGTHAAMEPAFRRHRPNHLAMWLSIQVACDRGFKHYDLGRTQPEDERLARFKAGWGASQTTLPYFYSPGEDSMRARYHSGSGNAIVSSIIRHSPRAVAATAANILYRHLGVAPASRRDVRGRWAIATAHCLRGYRP